MESSSFGMHAVGFAAPLPVTTRIAPASHEHDENAHALTVDAVHKAEDTDGVKTAERREG
ncbi:hypothetical protein AGMMS49545_08100 [Betaproteobacteria bacterium]|nr:hypothetical protein AGMMS49545_08100 [Betaproteobacteria bacterium]GHU40498.1 hypothetical protein AGMMS50289_02140 [Betaproteobacteria bacterium]